MVACANTREFYNLAGRVGVPRMFKWSQMIWTKRVNSNVPRLSNKFQCFFDPTFYFNEKSAVQVIFSPLSLRLVGGDLANHLRSNQRAQKALYLCGIYTYTHEMGQHFLNWYNFTLKAILTNIYQCYQTIKSNTIECYTSEKNIRKKFWFQYWIGHLTRK